MVLLPENSDEFCDDWIEEERLEIDIGLSEVYEYLVSQEGEAPSETGLYVPGDNFSINLEKKISICVE